MYIFSSLIYICSFLSFLLQPTTIIHKNGKKSTSLIIPKNWQIIDVFSFIEEDLKSNIKNTKTDIKVTTNNNELNLDTAKYPAKKIEKEVEKEVVKGSDLLSELVLCILTNEIITVFRNRID